jgi:hypothetical protein
LSHKCHKNMNPVFIAVTRRVYIHVGLGSHRQTPDSCLKRFLEARNPRGQNKKMSQPVSRVLSWTVIHLGPASPRASSNLPESGAGHANGFLFGLAPGGVYPAAGVTIGAVRSYRTISPLPCARKTDSGAVYFLWHFPSTRIAQALPGTLPFGARTFLHVINTQRLPGWLTGSLDRGDQGINL